MEPRLIDAEIDRDFANGQTAVRPLQWSRVSSTRRSIGTVEQLRTVPTFNGAASHRRGDLYC